MVLFFCVLSVISKVLDLLTLYVKGTGFDRDILFWHFFSLSLIIFFIFYFFCFLFLYLYVGGMTLYW